MCVCFRTPKEVFAIDSQMENVTWAFFSDYSLIIERFYVMCRVEENVPDLSYWSQFDCILHKTE